MTTEELLQGMLDKNREDFNTLLVLADHLEELGDPRGVGYRVMGLMGYYPRDHGRFCVWGALDHPNLNERYDYRWAREHTHMMLPTDWFRLMPFRPEEDDWQSSGREIWKRSKTRREADDQAAVAFSKLPRERQEQLLAEAWAKYEGRVPA